MPASPSSHSASSIAASVATGHHLLHIEGYSHTKELVPNGKCINSRPFMAAGHSWHISYYPNGVLRKTADYIAVYLALEYLAGEPAAAVNARAKFSLLDQAGKPVPRHTMTTGPRPSDFPAWGFCEFIPRASLEESPHLKDDRFTISCDIFVYSGTLTPAPAPAPPSDLRRHLGGLLAAGDGADVTLRVSNGGETFRAHRCVLAARSPVFKAELLGPMKEGDPAAVVEVGGDIDAETFRALLRFVYTDALPEKKMSPQKEAAMCQHLLVAADRYDMERLKLMCEARLREHIDTASVASILVLAEQHRCPGLKDACYRFLKKPGALAAVAAAEGFEHLSRSCPSVLKELVFRIIDGRT